MPNSFIGTGKIKDVKNDRVLKFTLVDDQGKPCLIPCVIFDTSNEFIKFIEQLEASGQTVWLRGHVASYDYEFRGKTVRKTEIVSYASCIKPI